MITDSRVALLYTYASKQNVISHNNYTKNQVIPMVSLINIFVKP